MRGVHSREELQGGGVELFRAFLEVLLEVFADCDVRVFLVEVVDVLAVHPSNDFK